MLNIIFYTVCCYVIQGLTAQTTNTISTLSLLTPSQSSHDEIQPSNLLDTTKSSNDRLLSALNLLKTTLTEELENPQNLVIEQKTRECLLTSLNSLLEEEKIKSNNGDEHQIQGLRNVNKIDEDKSPKIITKMESGFTKPINNTDTQANLEMPSMIPIFKPRTVLPRNEVKQNIVADFKSYATPKTNPNPKSVKFVPEKIVQTNMNLIPNSSRFNIPCHRAADVLDMTKVTISKQVCDNVEVNLPNLNSIQQAPKSSLPVQHPAPVTLSVNCADTDENVAMLFKPKKISLMQVYGNLLKEITITVLVPYHISKLA